MPTELLSAEDVAKQLHVKKTTIMMWANNRHLIVTLVGKKRFFTQETIDQYILSHTLKPEISYDWLVKSYGQEAVDKFIKEHTLEAKS